MPPLAAAPPAPRRFTAQRLAGDDRDLLARRPASARLSLPIAGQNPRRRRGTRRGSGVLPELQGCCGRANAATPSRAAGEPARPRGAPAPTTVLRETSSAVLKAAMASAESASMPGPRVEGGSSHELPRSPKKPASQPSSQRRQGRRRGGAADDQSSGRSPGGTNQPSNQPSSHRARAASQAPSSKGGRHYPSPGERMGRVERSVGPMPLHYGPGQPAKQPAKGPASQPRSQPRTGRPGRGVREASTREGTPPTAQYLNFSTVLQGYMLLAPGRLRHDGDRRMQGAPHRERKHYPSPGQQMGRHVAECGRGVPGGLPNFQGWPPAAPESLGGKNTGSCSFLHLP